jgi:hypothetical protein
MGTSSGSSVLAVMGGTILLALAALGLTLGAVPGCGSTSSTGDTDGGMKGTVGNLTFEGPASGEIFRLARSPQDPDKVYGIALGALIASTNGGQSWATLTEEDLPLLSSGTPAWLSDVIALPDGSVVLGLDRGILKSSNGVTWEEVAFPAAVNSGVTALAWEESTPPRLWAGITGSNTEGKLLWYLEEGATTWVEAPVPADLVTVAGTNQVGIPRIAIEHNDAGTYLYAMYQHSQDKGGMLCSRNGGASFEFCESGIAVMSGALLTDVKVCGNLIVASNVGTGGAYYSTDHGASWAGLGKSALPQSFTVVPLDDGSFVAGTYRHGVMRAAGVDAEWVADTDLESVDVLSLLPATDGSFLAGLDIYGVWRSPSGSTSWENSSQGVVRAMVWSTAVNPRDPNQIVATVSGSYGSGVLSTIDGGATWRRLTGPQPSYNHVGMGRSGAWYLVSQGDQFGRWPESSFKPGLYRSTDRGATITQITNAFPEDFQLVRLEGAFDDEAGQNIVLVLYVFVPDSSSVDRTIVVASNDGGQTWTQRAMIDKFLGAEPRMTSTGDLYVRINDIDIDSQGNRIDVALIKHISPTGETRDITTPLTWLSSATPCSADPQRLLAAGCRDNCGTWEVVRSEDGGETWDRVFEFTDAGLLAINHPLDCDIIVVQTFKPNSIVGHFAKSADNGATWEDMPIDIAPRGAVWDLLTGEAGDGRNAVMFMRGHGVWTAQLGMKKVD